MNIETNPKLHKCARINDKKVLFKCELSEWELKTKNYALAINRSEDRYVKISSSIVDTSHQVFSKVILPK
jgi:hypothetical protein